MAKWARISLHLPYIASFNEDIKYQLPQIDEMLQDPDSDVRYCGANAWKILLDWCK